MTKILTSIVILLFSIVTFQDISSASDVNLESIGSTYKARVVTAKAVVYADENMNTPIGYIVSGRIITVGNPRRINKSLVPLVISGRLAFIEIKDLRYLDEKDELESYRGGAPREHDVDVTIQKIDEKLSENNFGFFGLHQFSAGEELQTMFEELDSTSESTISGFTLSLIHRQTTSKYFWGGQFEYNSASTENVKFAYYILGPTFGYSLFKNKLFVLDLVASLDFSLAARIDIQNNFENEPDPFIWGPQLSSRLILFPNNKYFFTASLGIRNYSVYKISPLVKSDETEATAPKSLSGFNILFGMGMRFD